MGSSRRGNSWFPAYRIGDHLFHGRKGPAESLIGKDSKKMVHLWLGERHSGMPYREPLRGRLVEVFLKDGSTPSREVWRFSWVLGLSQGLLASSRYEELGPGFVPPSVSDACKNGCCPYRATGTITLDWSVAPRISQIVNFAFSPRKRWSVANGRCGFIVLLGGRVSTSVAVRMGNVHEFS